MDVENKIIRLFNSCNRSFDSFLKRSHAEPKAQGVACTAETVACGAHSAPTELQLQTQNGTSKHLDPSTTSIFNDTNKIQASKTANTFCCVGLNAWFVVSSMHLFCLCETCLPVGKCGSLQSGVLVKPTEASGTRANTDTFPWTKQARRIQGQKSRVKRRGRTPKARAWAGTNHPQWERPQRLAQQRSWLGLGTACLVTREWLLVNFSKSS